MNSLRVGLGIQKFSLTRIVHLAPCPDCSGIDCSIEAASPPMTVPKKLVVCLSLLGGLASVALGAEFHPVSSVSSPTAGSDLWPVSNLIQGPGVGFDGSEPHDQLGSGSSSRWVTDAPGGFPSDYIAEAGEPVLVFDLGSEVSLAEVSVWGYATSNANGVSEFGVRPEIEISNDGKAELIGTT